MYGYDYSYNYDAYESGLIGFSIVYMLFVFAIAIFMFVCVWKIFKKAGKNGWEAIIPIYSNIVMLEIAGLPTWYIILYFIPIANIYVTFKVYIELAQKFGKSAGFGVGMVFIPVVFMPMLAFGKDTYNGSNSQAQQANVNSTVQNQRFCPNCGNQLDANTVFCANCGTKVE